MLHGKEQACLGQKSRSKEVVFPHCCGFFNAVQKRGEWGEKQKSCSAMRLLFCHCVAASCTQLRDWKAVT